VDTRAGLDAVMEKKEILSHPRRESSADRKAIRLVNIVTSGGAVREV
jgi:hypothetical protein